MRTGENPSSYWLILPAVTVIPVQSVVPIFVSSGRSGLTLLRMIFDSHPELAVAHEPRFLATMAPNHSRYEGSGGLDIDRFLGDLYAVSNFRRLGLPREEVRSAIEDQRPAGFADAVRIVFAMYAQTRGKDMYGDKTPLYISFIEPIAGLFPEARFVHLVRDGRDVVLAYLERDKGPATVAEGAFHWKLRVSRGHRAAATLGPDRYREFHYEDLIEDPEATVRSMCEYLGLDFHEEMLDYQGTAERFLAEAKNPADHQHLTMAPNQRPDRLETLHVGRGPGPVRGHRRRDVGGGGLPASIEETGLTAGGWLGMGPVADKTRALACRLGALSPTATWRESLVGGCR